MLNELAVLMSSLQHYGAVESATHPWVKRLGRSPTLIVGVDDGGRVNTLELRSAEEAVGLFKIHQSNHCHFPDLNPGVPVWELNPRAPATVAWLESSLEDVRGRSRLLRAACGGARVSSDIGGSFAAFRRACNELHQRFAHGEAEFRAFGVLIDRLLAAIAGNEEEWFHGLSELALKSAEERGAEFLEQAELLLAGRWDAAKQRFAAKKMPVLLFDVADYSNFDCRVADGRMAAYFSRQLLATEPGTGDEGTCRLTGRRMVVEREKLPSPRLPVLGDTYLMSMNKDTPCQRRYGQIGPDIFSIGKDTAAELSSALVQLTKPEREFRNWQRVPGTVRSKSNLLIRLPAAHPPPPSGNPRRTDSSRYAASYTVSPCCLATCNTALPKPSVLSSYFDRTMPASRPEKPGPRRRGEPASPLTSAHPRSALEC